MLSAIHHLLSLQLSMALSLHVPLGLLMKVIPSFNFLQVLRNT